MKKRKVQYIVNKRMQFAFTMRFLLITILFSLFVGFQVYFTIWPVASEFVPTHLMHLVKSQIFFRTILFLFPAIFVISAFAILFSHRIAGPLYRLERTLDKVIQGEDVEYIQLRKKDELKDLAGRINEIIAIIKGSRGPTKKDTFAAK